MQCSVDSAVARLDSLWRYRASAPFRAAMAQACKAQRGAAGSGGGEGGTDGGGPSYRNRLDPQRCQLATLPQARCRQRELTAQAGGAGWSPRPKASFEGPPPRSSVCVVCVLQCPGARGAVGSSPPSRPLCSAPRDWVGRSHEDRRANTGARAGRQDSQHSVPGASSPAVACLWSAAVARLYEQPKPTGCLCS